MANPVEIRKEVSEPINNNYTAINSMDDTKSSSSESTEFTPPDGGWGWVVVFASFMISFIGDGVTHSFGILFIEFDNYFGASKSTTAWVGSLFFSLPLLTGPIASYFTDRWGCRIVTIIGALIASFAFAAGFLATKLNHLIIAFSISGLGLSLCYVTSVVIVAYYFDKKRSLANGLATCGAGVGTIVFPLLTIYLVEEYAWRGTVLLLSGAFLNMTIFGILMRDLDYPDSSSEDDDETDHRVSIRTDSITEESLSTSLLQLPTYITDENLNPEVFHELSNKEGGHLSYLIEQYPDILNSYLQDLDEPIVVTQPSDPTNELSTVEKETKKDQPQDVRRYRKSTPQKAMISQCPLMPGFYICQHHPSYFRNIRLHPGNLMYRGAMLNIPRYHLRTSSCPNIYKNALSVKGKGKRNQFLSGLNDLLLDMVDIRIFRNIPYTMFCISNLFLYGCLDIPYVYIPDYAVDRGISLDSASLLISILGILNTLGMVIFGYIGDRSWIDPAFVYSITMCVSGISIGCLPFVKQYSSMAATIAMYGFSVSTNYALTASLLVELISLDNFTNAYGLLLSVQGMATLVGPPLGGWLYDMFGSYDVPFCTTGICTFLSGIIVLPLSKKLKLKISSKSFK